MKTFKMMPVAVALVASFAAAQSTEDVQKQLARQEAELKRINAELTELKANGAMTAADAALETEVNRLSERLAAATTVKSGANQITFAGEFRSRFEMSSDYVATGWARQNYNLARVAMHYDFSKDITAAIALQNTWVTGTEPGTGSNDSIDAYEAWVEMRNFFTNGLTLKHGRQEFVKGTEFQFGNQSFEDGLVWDGHRLDWSNESFGITGFLFNETGFVTDVDVYTSGIYGTIKSIKDVTIDAYWINRDASGSHASTDTIGARAGGAMSNVDFNLEVAFQDNNLADDPMALEANVGYMFSKDNKFHAHAQYALLENGYQAPAMDLGADRYGYALSLFGTGAGANSVFNLESISLGLSFDPSAHWSLSAKAFFNDQDVAVLPGIDGSWTEIDVSADYRYSDNLTLTVGLGLVMPGEDAIEDAFLGYLQARLTF